MAEVEAGQQAVVVEHRIAAEMHDIAARASALAQEIIGSVVIAEVPRLEIAVEAPGLTKTVSVESPARPGAVRAAVEKMLRDLGLTRL
jgi:hypothetical protein